MLITPPRIIYYFMNKIGCGTGHKSLTCKYAARRTSAVIQAYKSEKWNMSRVIEGRFAPDLMTAGIQNQYSKKTLSIATLQAQTDVVEPSNAKPKKTPNSELPKSASNN